MRNPRRVRNICASIVLVSVAVFASSFLLNDAPTGMTVPKVMRLSGLVCIVFAGIGVVVMHVSVRSRDRLHAGKGLVARWRVSAEQWRAFCAINATLDAQRGPNLRNALSLKTDATGRDVEVLIGAKAVEINGEFRHLPIRKPRALGAVLLSGPPACVELALLFPGGMDTMDSLVSFRFPIASGPEGEALAQRVLAHFNSPRAPATS